MALHEIDSNNTYQLGGILNRSYKSFNRLEAEPYRTEKIFQDSSYSWPGDWEGRTLLGIITLAKATHRNPLYLKDIMNELPKHLNGKGYFGEMMPQGQANEQQLAGNSWFLRAMCEAYEWTGDEACLKMIRNIVRNLLLPLRSMIEYYPAGEINNRELRAAIGEISDRKLNGWLLSSDTGCVFIMLDGAAHAYQITKNEELRILIEQMIKVFRSIDVVGSKFQTHATLSAVRGILRFYDLTKEAQYLEHARYLMELYTRLAMTENYENYNWFQRPEWTEPCAFIDSYIANMELFRMTEKGSYLETAHKIYLNAIAFAQRSNGGFGADVCSGVKDEFLGVSEKELYEAYWCCTMRGAEGLSKAARYQYLRKEDGALVVTAYDNSLLVFKRENDSILLKQSTQYPESGYTLFEIIEGSREALKMNLFLPSYVDREGFSITLNGEPYSEPIHREDGFIGISITPAAGTRLELRFDIPCIKAATRQNHIKGNLFFHGYALLGLFNKRIPLNEEIKPVYEEMMQYEILPDTYIRPVFTSFYLTKPNMLNTRIQIIF